MKKHIAQISARNPFIYVQFTAQGRSKSVREKQDHAPTSLPLNILVTGHNKSPLVLKPISCNLKHSKLKQEDGLICSSRT